MGSMLSAIETKANCIGGRMKRINLAMLAGSLLIVSTAFAGPLKGLAAPSHHPSSFEEQTDPDDRLANTFWSMMNDNLALKFSLANGKPDDVVVLIKDSAGRQVVDTRSDGPLLFAKLPAGDYTIEAELGGKVVVRSVTLSSYEQSKLYINWGDDDVSENP
jgi:hypothetical protein